MSVYFFIIVTIFICLYIYFWLKMVPHTAAMVLRYPVVLVFLLFFPVFCFSNTISFTREELLNIWQNTTKSPTSFRLFGCFAEHIVGGAAALIRRSEPVRLWSSDSADFECHCLASIWRISALYPTKRLNPFRSPGQIRIFQTLLLCVSQKPVCRPSSGQRGCLQKWGQSLVQSGQEHSE